jgi:transposase InsO family protein
MSARLEFVEMARAPGANLTLLCRTFGVSRKTAYKWLDRFEELGQQGLANRSRRPLSSPVQCSTELEAAILALHDTYPCWGSRKLRALLPEDESRPHHSTIDAILRRHGKQILGSRNHQDAATSRFEHDAPNQLWQMDFKGHFALTDQRAGRCHPLTILDDHSRFNLCLAACGNERGTTVKSAMEATFQRYGLPERITADNGPPWGVPCGQGITALEIWLIRLGIRVSHSRPYHPQTQGKDERFHRTLKLELLDRQGFTSLDACQAAFDTWRDRYNLLRPHEALGQQPPVRRYQPSGRPFPSVLPPLEYLPADRVLKVRPNGSILLGSRHCEIYLGEGLVGEHVAVRPAGTDGVYKVYFCHTEIREIDLRQVP